MVSDHAKNVDIAFLGKRKAILLIHSGFVDVGTALDRVDLEGRMAKIGEEKVELFLEFLFEMGREDVITLFEAVAI